VSSVWHVVVPARGWACQDECDEGGVAVERDEAAAWWRWGNVSETASHVSSNSTTYRGPQHTVPDFTLQTCTLPTSWCSILARYRKRHLLPEGFSLATGCSRVVVRKTDVIFEITNFSRRVVQKSNCSCCHTVLPHFNQAFSRAQLTMDDFQLATDRFLSWFQSAGGEFREDLLEVRDLRVSDAGRGIGEARSLGLWEYN
jgi:hypothetical protein